MKIKKKLRDLTEEEFYNWGMKNCLHISCDICPFKMVDYNLYNKNSWVNNKDLYSDKFLNQEVEIDVKNILTNEEKEYLRNIIKPFRNDVDYIHKELGSYEYEYIFIEMNCHSMEKNYHTICLPPFPRNSMYKNMESACAYTLAQLEL